MPLIRPPRTDVGPWWLADISALGAARIAVGLASALKAFIIAGAIGFALEGTPKFPAVGPFGLGALLPSEIAVALTLLVGVSGLALAGGAWPRLAAATLAAGGVGVLVFDARLWSNHLLLIVLLAAILAASGGGRWRTQRELTRSPAAILLCTQISTVYLYAGLSKLNGEFLSGAVLRSDMANGFLSAVPVLQKPGVSVALSMGAVVVELVLGITLWFRRTRLFAAALGVFFHATLILTVGPWLDLVVFAVLCVGTYPLFLTRPTADVNTG